MCEAEVEKHQPRKNWSSPGVYIRAS